MKKQWNILRSFAADNRGSGIVTVLVIMVCVALMGTSILFMSYTGFRTKTTERQATKDFYSAEIAMDEIRAGLQAEVSGAIATSYKSVLEKTYSSSTNIGRDFEEFFKNDMKKARIFPDGSGEKYDVSVLKSFVSDPSVIVEGDYGNSTTEGAVERNENTFDLKGIKITYTADGYTTEITTDFSINMPKFAYVMSATSISGLPEHALIARDALVHSIGNTQIQIAGSAYAGEMVLNESGSTMTISNGTLVCARDVKVSGSGSAVASGNRLVTDSSAKLWAGRIEVNGGSAVKLSGETRVLDDLELAGRESKATLFGSYYGFGDGTIPAGTGGSAIPANYSSAILINGLKSTLDVSGLNRLMLAGRSYISDSLYAGAASTDAVGTLESVSVRSNQQMYLIDPAYLGMGEGLQGDVTENPFISGDSNPVVGLNAAGQELAETHNFTLKRLRHAVPGATGQWIYYYFMDFDDSVTASAYFEEYFAKNGGQMNSYLDSGSKLNALGTSTLGYTIRGRDGNYVVSQPNGVSFDCAGMLSTFNQLKKTLVDANTTATASDPYEYIVDTAKVNDIDGTYLFEDGSGNIVGLVTDGSYTIRSTGDSYPNLKVVIAAGDVNVERDFTGLIISGGTVAIKDELDMKADELGVMAAFAAVNTEDDEETLGSYLLHGANASNSTTVVDRNEGWNMDTLVTYKNWSKN